jgi:hypothetical protein
VIAHILGLPTKEASQSFHARGIRRLRLDSGLEGARPAGPKPTPSGPRP